MKKHLILSAGFVIATIAVAIATQSVNQVPPRGEAKSIEVKMTRAHRYFNSGDVEFLMRANHVNREQAVEILMLASQAAEVRMAGNTEIEPKR
jgi:hypothetical protein